ncbi:PH domain-containing protein [Exiguobacterium antarcticum]|uniref:PH domain-containing protein n=1 Tax=Exiguobacterium antarcticum TaxID=132920 RepID=UPI00059C10A3|nr:PH domain-containing protein [Exiguobacterium antarcticum]
MSNPLGQLAWTFVSECDIPQDVQGLLIQGERALSAYKTIRDVAIFTTHRLIIRDAQGLTGKKVEVYSIPYKSINMYSTENAGGMFDINSEVQLFTRAGTIKINLNKKVDVRKIDLLIANAIL